MSREAPLAAEEAYEEMLAGVDSLLTKDELSEQVVNRALSDLEKKASQPIDGIYAKRWQQLVQIERTRVIESYIHLLLDSERTKKATGWLDRLQGEQNNPTKLLLDARLHAASGDTIMALSESLTALFYSRSPSAEAAVVSYYSPENSGLSYTEYRDAFLEKQAEFKLTAYYSEVGKQPEVDRYLASRLFDRNSAPSAGLVACWDEFLSNQDQIYLTELYQAAMAHGLGFILCYAGSDTDAARLNLPSGVPIAGVELVREEKSARKLEFSSLPFVMVITKNGQRLYQTEGDDRSLPAMLPLLLNRIASYKGQP